MLLVIFPKLCSRLHLTHIISNQIIFYIFIMNFYQKYLKYKKKYLDLKQKGGNLVFDMPRRGLCDTGGLLQKELIYGHPIYFEANELIDAYFNDKFIATQEIQSTGGNGPELEYLNKVHPEWHINIHKNGDIMELEILKDYAQKGIVDWHFRFFLGLVYAKSRDMYNDECNAPYYMYDNHDTALSLNIRYYDENLRRWAENEDAYDIFNYVPFYDYCTTNVSLNKVAVAYLRIKILLEYIKYVNNGKGVHKRPNPGGIIYPVNLPKNLTIIFDRIQTLLAIITLKMVEQCFNYDEHYFPSNDDLPEMYPDVYNEKIFNEDVVRMGLTAGLIDTFLNPINSYTDLPRLVIDVVPPDAEHKFDRFVGARIVGGADAVAAGAGGP
jgi:hypothetical protein